MYSVVLLLAASTGGEAAGCPPAVFIPCQPVCYPCPPVLFACPRVVIACPTVVVRPVVVRPVLAVPAAPSVQIKVRTQVGLGIQSLLDLLGEEEPLPRARLSIDVGGKTRLELRTGGKAPADEDEEDQEEEEAPRPKVKVREAAPCTIKLSVPAQARVYVDGELTRSTSARRTFVTPPLAPGRTFSYKVKVEFERDGEKVAIKRTVKVSAGATAQLTVDPDDEE
jgi:uncharacterized protein (TIGR03000 family)